MVPGNIFKWLDRDGEPPRVLNNLLAVRLHLARKTDCHAELVTLAPHCVRCSAGERLASTKQNLDSRCNERDLSLRSR